MKAHSLERRSYETIIWGLCALSALFLASRITIRKWKKGRLKRSDYPLLLALPCLFIGTGLLHSSLDLLYATEPRAKGVPADLKNIAGETSRLVAAVELLWICIYCVKASFLAQFKFHKPPFALISLWLTRYYWVTIVICVLSYLFAFVVPVLLCPISSRCWFFTVRSTVAWECALTAIDICTDLLIIVVPVTLVRMANFTKSRAALNTIFKSLSVLTMAIAAARLALQYDSRLDRINYMQLTLWLAVEAAVAIIAASVSSYRIVLLDYPTDLQAKTQQQVDRRPTKRPRRFARWIDKCQGDVAKITTLSERHQHDSQVELTSHPTRG